jgi:hypothetical protein
MPKGIFRGIEIWFNLMSQYFLAVLGFGTQSLALTKQGLNHLSHSPTLFNLVIFQVRSHIFAKGQLQTTIFLPLTTT